MAISRTTLVTVVLAVAAGIAVQQERQRRVLAHAVAELRQQVGEARAGAVALGEEEAGLVAAARADRAAAEAADALRERMGREAAAGGAQGTTSWAVPPADWPSWTPGSPYVWVEKAVVPQLPFHGLAFDAAGRLSGPAKEILAVDDATATAVGQRLAAVVHEARSARAARAHRVDQHLPAVSGQPGEKLTLRFEPDPETAGRLRQEFLQALQDGLGPGRATLLSEVASAWIDSQLSALQGEGMTVSVVWRADGSESVAIQAGTGFVSASGPGVLAGHLPPELLPLFAPEARP